MVTGLVTFCMLCAANASALPLGSTPLSLNLSIVSHLNETLHWMTESHDSKRGSIVPPSSLELLAHGSVLVQLLGLGSKGPQGSFNYKVPGTNPVQQFIVYYDMSTRGTTLNTATPIETPGGNHERRD